MLGGRGRQFKAGRGRQCEGAWAGSVRGQGQAV